MITGHGGNIHELAERLGCMTTEIIDMSSNVNPLGPPPGLMKHLKEQISLIEALPEADSRGTIKAFAKRYCIDPEKVLAGNGTTQFIYALPQVLQSQKVLILGPAYSDYADACKMHHVPFDFAMAQDTDDFCHDLNQVEKLCNQYDTVFICNPNNPTGAMIPGSALKKLCQDHPDTFFVIDESYLPFVAEGESESLIREDAKNLVVLNSMSKIFRLPGLRIGFVVGDRHVISKFIRFYLPWSVNSLAQAAVVYLMEQQEKVDRFVCQSRQHLEKERNLFMQRMNQCPGIRLFSSTTSFVLAKLTCSVNSGKIHDFMACHRILIRNCDNFVGLSNRFIRISLKTPEINELAADKLIQIIQTACKDVS